MNTLGHVLVNGGGESMSMKEGGEIKIGPWTYRVCKIKQQTDNEVLFYATPINKEGG